MTSRRSVFTGLIAAFTAACSKLVFVAANVPAAFGSYERRADIAYGDHPKQRLDVYLPDTAAASPKPLVVFFYGGRWETGDKDEYKFVGAALASLGYVAVLPNYRHYAEVKIQGFMEDAARGASFAFEHAVELGADPARFYLMGHSAGAHIAAMLALNGRYFDALGHSRPRVAGLIGLSGPYDFLPLTDDDLKDMFGPPSDYADSQPINFVSAASPPALLLQGQDDKLVAPKNSVNLAAALRARGVFVTLKLLPKLGHADTVAALSIPGRGRASTLADVETFVSRRQSS